jgi:hypothetical protein
VSRRRRVQRWSCRPERPDTLSRARRECPRDARCRRAMSRSIFIKYDPYFDRPDVYGTAATPTTRTRRSATHSSRAPLWRSTTRSASAPTLCTPTTGPRDCFRLFRRSTRSERPRSSPFTTSATRAASLSESRRDRHRPGSPHAAGASGGDINYMAAAIRSATVVNTVSERYAQEIQTRLRPRALMTCCETAATRTCTVSSTGSTTTTGTPVRRLGTPCPYSARPISRARRAARRSCRSGWGCRSIRRCRWRSR